MIARVRSCSAIGAPSGHCARSRRVACTIVSSYSFIRSPWNGGSSRRRWRMCSGPVSVSTELGPITAAIGELPAAEGATSGGAVNTCLTSSAPLTTTIRRPLGKKRIVNISP